jgi:very-short-patch-repair endonuclease
MAAALAGGPDAVLSHRSAADLWGIRRSSRRVVEVTSSLGGSRPGIQFHRSRLCCDEVTVERGVPVTTVPRTLLDLAGVVDGRQLERAINEADVLRLWNELSLHDVLSRYPRRPGTAALRTALAARRNGATVTASELEEELIRLVDLAGVRRPEVNVPLEAGGRRWEVDCLWRPERLALELDGRAAHLTVAAFERDRERDRILQASGWRTARITWRQMKDSPRLVTRDLWRLLGAET